MIFQHTLVVLTFISYSPITGEDGILPRKNNSVLLLTDFRLSDCKYHAEKIYSLDTTREITHNTRTEVERITENVEDVRKAWEERHELLKIAKTRFVSYIIKLENVF